MQDRLSRFAAVLLLCSLPAVAHAEFIDWLGNALVEGLFILGALIGIPIIIYKLLRSPKAPDFPPKQWPPKE